MSRVALEDLWREHREAPFPPECRQARVAGIDLAALEADVAACVQGFLVAGSLDREGRETLARCLDDLDIALSKLGGASREYFVRLRRLALLVIEAQA